MAPCTQISTPNAPGAIGPYSQAIRAGDFLFVSGQIPLNPATGQVVEGGIAEQTHQVLKNLGAVLAAAGASYGQVVKTTVYLQDMADFAAMNEIYGRYFSPRPGPRHDPGGRLPRVCGWKSTSSRTSGAIVQTSMRPSSLRPECEPAVLIVLCVRPPTSPSLELLSPESASPARLRARRTVVRVGLHATTGRPVAPLDVRHSRTLSTSVSLFPTSSTPSTLFSDLTTLSRCLRSLISTVMRIDPRWPSSTVASTSRMLVLMSEMRDVTSARMPRRSSTLMRRRHGVGRRVGGLVPFHVDAPLGVVQQVDDVRADRGVHGHALAARDVADDLLAADRVAAAGAEHHQVVHAADLDLAVAAGAEHALDDGGERAVGRLLLERVLADEAGQHRPGPSACRSPTIASRSSARCAPYSPATVAERLVG